MHAAEKGRGGAVAATWIVREGTCQGGLVPNIRRGATPRGADIITRRRVVATNAETSAATPRPRAWIFRHISALHVGLGGHTIHRGGAAAAPRSRPGYLAAIGEDSRRGPFAEVLVAVRRRRVRGSRALVGAVPIRRIDPPEAVEGVVVDVRLVRRRVPRLARVEPGPRRRRVPVLGLADGVEARGDLRCGRRDVPARRFAVPPWRQGVSRSRRGVPRGYSGGGSRRGHGAAVRAGRGPAAGCYVDIPRVRRAAAAVERFLRTIHPRCGLAAATRLRG